MSGFGRKTADNALTGVMFGILARMGYDKFNHSRMIKKFNKNGEIPKRKSMLLAVVFTTLFGSLGLLYSSPRVAIPLIIIEAPFLIIFFLFNIVIRPIVILIAIASVISHNEMRNALFAGYDQVGGVNK